MIGVFLQSIFYGKNGRKRGGEGRGEGGGKMPPIFPVIC